MHPVSMWLPCSNELIFLSNNKDKILIKVVNKQKNPSNEIAKKF